jgi:hypothetical protein
MSARLPISEKQLRDKTVATILKLLDGISEPGRGTRADGAIFRQKSGERGTHRFHNKSSVCESFCAWNSREYRDIPLQW